MGPDSYRIERLDPVLRDLIARGLVTLSEGSWQLSDALQRHLDEVAPSIRPVDSREWSISTTTAPGASNANSPGCGRTSTSATTASGTMSRHSTTQSRRPQLGTEAGTCEGTAREK
jgi:hypothetical protein